MQNSAGQEAELACQFQISHRMSRKNQLLIIRMVDRCVSAGANSDQEIHREASELADLLLRGKDFEF